MHLLLSLPPPWIGASGNPQTLAASAGSSAEPRHQRGRPPRLSTRRCSVCISQKMIWANTMPAAAAAVQFVAARFSSLLLWLKSLNVSPVTSSRPRQREGKRRAGGRTGSWVMTLLLFHCSGVRTDWLSPPPSSSCADTSSDPSDLAAAVTVAAAMAATAATAASRGCSSGRKQGVFASRTPVLLDPLKQKLIHHTQQRKEGTQTQVDSVFISYQRCSFLPRTLSALRMILMIDNTLIPSCD